MSHEKLQRTTLEALQRLRPSIVWPTQPNDLRRLANAPINTQRDAMASELKCLCLLHDTVVLADAYVINNIGMQKLIIENADDFVTAAMGNGFVRLSLRKDMPTYLSLTTNTPVVHNMRRKAPGTIERVAQVDDVLRRAGVRVLELPMVKNKLPQLIDRLFDLPPGHLDDDEKAFLRVAVDRATEESTDGILRGGVVRRLLSETPAAARVARATSVATFLALPLALNFHTSVAANDIDPGLVLGINGPLRNGGPTDEEEVAKYFPKRVLPKHLVDLMSFKRIWSLRRTPEGTAYQEALRAATAVRGTKQWKKHYVRYLETIPDYFERIGSDARIELVDWQKVLARQETERRERFARRLGKGVAFPWAVGVLAGAVSWWLYELSPAGVEHIGSRVAHGVELAREFAVERHAAHRTNRLRRLLERTSVIPPEPDSGSETPTL